MNTKNIALIGPGRVGRAMARLLPSAGYEIAAFGGRDPARLREAIRTLNPPPEICTITEATSRADLVLLTVRDDAIEEIARQGAFRRGAIVLHLSGALGSNILQPAKEHYGCFIASMHPLQTFATVEQAVLSLPGSFCFIEGDEPAAQAAERIAEALGMIPRRILSEHKTTYHTAAVLACSGLTALLHAAEQTAQAAGIARDDFWTAFSPLMQATFRNVRALGAAAALTGPAKRGDTKTIHAHLDALASHPDLQKLYRLLSDHAARINEETSSHGKESNE
ncbi:MAG: DUF2520 domain-containing protein [Kiritimatiellae bacterium]|nr:DUF2520 domain-containing protein [Kiritimatiellia bacterium]